MNGFLKIAVVLGAVDRASAVIDKFVNGSKKKMDELTKSQRAANFMNDTSVKATAAGAAITGFFAETVKAAEDSEVATKRLEQVFRSMGDATGKNAMQAAEYASQLQLLIGVEDEEIMAVQAKLATFKHESDAYAMRTGLFQRLTNAAFDMQAAGFGDALGNITQLGKAFEDPIRGATALKRTGALTAAEVDKIGNIAKTQGMRKAQEAMLAALEKQVKGVAKSTATPTQLMKIQFGEIAETMGKQLLPEINKFAKWLGEVVPKVTKFIEKNSWLVKGVAALGVALMVLGPVLMVAAAATTVFNAAMLANPITWIVLGIIAAIVALVAIVAVIIANWDRIKLFFSTMWDSVKATFVAAVEFIKGLFNKFGEWMFGFPARLYQAGINIVTSIWNGIKAKWGDFIGWWEGKVKMVRDFLPFSPAKRGPLKDIHRIKLVETIAEGVKPAALVSKMNATMGAVRQSINIAPSTFSASAIPMAASGTGGGAVITYAPVINMSGGSAADKQQFAEMLGKHKDELMRIISAELQRSSRRAFA